MTEKRRLEIKHLLELNCSGSIRFDEMTKLLSYMEQYWTQPEPLPTGDEAGVFKAFMEQAWHEALAVGEAEDKGRTAQNNKEVGANIDWDDMYQQITGHSTMTAGDASRSLRREKGGRFPAIRVKGSRIMTLKWAVTAAVVVLVSIGGWWFTARQDVEKQVVHHGQGQLQDLPAPSAAKAILVLADGRQIALDGSGNGVIADQQKVSVLLNGKNSLAYDLSAGSGNGQVQYNELRVLKGSQPVSVSLSDGSKIWLNVGSSLRYPTMFGSGSREVSLNGEAYFEVHHEVSRPFIVHHGSMAVKVLGTHFNMNTYTDEPSLKVTLLQGAVDVNKNDHHLLLQPGQQAIVARGAGGSLTLNHQVDLDQVLSWKSAEFVFGPGTDFKSIMRQIARWYDVQISYAGPVAAKFWGSVPRTASIQEVLRLLEATGGVRFELAGRQLKVIPVQ
ncbi:FecR family protein [Arachidicoccus terrestris]|uniref:FecR family protein n=1 Tax=Arachidicoccus terrestris TaxID=2875539 RepID=UPI001CC6679D|nr:FecR domain-containing protein [Arachidicoccus terrestris]UAY55556.1 FecR domain-containing protein [Arachidicoccus terrestris]